MSWQQRYVACNQITPPRHSRFRRVERKQEEVFDCCNFGGICKTKSRYNTKLWLTFSTQRLGVTPPQLTASVRSNRQRANGFELVGDRRCNRGLSRSPHFGCCAWPDCSCNFSWSSRLLYYQPRDTNFPSCFAVENQNPKKWVDSELTLDDTRVCTDSFRRQY